MRINTNVGALTAARNVGMVQKAVASSSEKLSSGFRINKAADDAAGLGIANILRSDIRSFNQASRNAEQANSVYNIAEGAAQNVQKVLERMKELAAQAASDSVDSNARSRINSEFGSLRSEITRVVSTTKFQGQTLLNGSYGASVTSTAFAGTSGVYAVDHVGAAAGTFTLSNSATVASLSGASGTQTVALTASSAQTLNFSNFGLSVRTSNAVADGSMAGNITVTAGSGTFLVGASGAYTGNDTISISGSSLNLTASNLGIASSATDTLANAQTALTNLDTAIGVVNTALGVIGAGQSRIDVAVDTLKTSIQNFAAAESTIRDLDMADEMVKFSKNQILVQAGTAMLAQANQSGQGVLSLLRG